MKTQHFYTELSPQKRKTKLGMQNGPTTKKGVLLVIYFLKDIVSG